MSNEKSVAVLGAGIAGLTAAHELLERGFRVTIFDKRSLAEWGGKARSYGAKMRAAEDGRTTAVEVPAEHGFHFFPGFYRHVDDTLKRIPARSGTVFSHLVSAEADMLAVTGKPRILVPTSAPGRPHPLATLRSFLQFPKDLTEVGLTKEDISIFAGKLWQIASSSPERRNEEYENVDWRTFVESLDRSEEYYWFLASGITRTLVAARARRASTRTMGNIALQLLLCLAERGNTMDRVLDGPTNDVWIRPWLRHMKETWPDKLEQEVLTVDEIALGRGSAIEIGAQGRRRGPFDYVVCALPIEAVVGLADSQANEAFAGAGRETLNGLRELASHNLAVMAGLQIFLRKDLEICKGHQMLLDSDWGLTSISQWQFWGEAHRKRLAESGIGGLISIDISTWDLSRKGGIGSAASLAAQGRTHEIFKEALRQLRSGLGDEGLDDRPGGNVMGWHLEEQSESVLVNAKGTWKLRPTTRFGELPNLFLAGDYVRTGTDLACMESANESGRRAVNAILAAERRDDLCQTFDPLDREPSWLKLFQDADDQRFRQGLPWGGVDLSDAALSMGWALDTVGDLLLVDDRRSFSLLPPGHPGAPTRLPREEWDPSFRVRRTSGAEVSSYPSPKQVSPRGQRAVERLRIAAEAARPLRDEEVQQLLGQNEASPGRKDPMFRRWRLYKLRDEGVDYCFPFHVYDGDALVIHGLARNVPALHALTGSTAYRPVVGRLSSVDARFGTAGQEIGYAELWVVDYRDTLAGPYKEIVLNFVVTTSDRHRTYRWRSPYSSIVPMMDSSNRLFTPLLLVDQALDPAGQPGAVQYGNKIFGTNKLPAKIQLTRKARGDVERLSWRQLDRPEDHGSGSCPELDDPTQDVADYVQLSRELGIVELIRNARQASAGEELNGGLITRDMRDPKPLQGGATVDIRAAYKFSPKMRLLPGDAVSWSNRPAPISVEEASFDLARLLSFIDFHPTIATYDHHLKSVLYLDDWPTPEGPPIP